MLVDRTEITSFIEKEKANGKTVVLTNGCFDILHAGHVRYLASARAVGDCLVLGLNSDESVRRLKGPSRPINSELDRAEVIGGLRSVDYVVIFGETTAEALVREVRPDYYAKGGDYSLDSLPEAKAVAECGGQVVFLPFVEGKSSTNIIQKIEQNAKE
ncbi:MAG: D-glycero-beta-D-manno-heptose 1-phosphate adenylyltransferase [Selenomonadales bacterium]|nr:D-glycero-beta-D-manno-heptose 1-phosphate adenylyltransferase [Selenomonadales bacterium]